MNVLSQRQREYTLRVNVTEPKERPVYVKPYVPPKPIEVEAEFEIVSITRAG